MVRRHLSEREENEIWECGAPYTTTTILLSPQTAINYTVVSWTGESDTDEALQEKWAREQG